MRRCDSPILSNRRHRFRIPVLLVLLRPPVLPAKNPLFRSRLCRSGLGETRLLLLQSQHKPELVAFLPGTIPVELT
jgi:hypothetical protein